MTHSFHAKKNNIWRKTTSFLEATRTVEGTPAIFFKNEKTLSKVTSAVWFYIIYLPDARAVAQEVFPILHDSDEVAMCANRAQTKMILAAMKQFG